MKIQAGLTLIELLVVIAIIGIIASIATNQYQQYLSQSKAMAAYTEIAAGKTNFIGHINNGETVSSVADIGLQSLTNHCAITVTAASIRCELQNTPSSLVNSTIVLNYDLIQDQWLCATTNMSADIRPKFCS
ncbi:pilin [Deefgea piscis]|uniref:pilin n=1 Tax=Deefgea piscis TaxID=2739061 RepID=UPI00210420C5|nr:pilin [Deefgea piscis]